MAFTGILGKIDSQLAAIELGFGTSNALIYSPTGGLSLTGIENTFSASPIGNISLNGSFLTKITFNIISSGRITLTGVSLPSLSNISNATGNFSLSGTANVQETDIYKNIVGQIVVNGLADNILVQTFPIGVKTRFLFPVGTTINKDNKNFTVYSGKADGEIQNSYFVSPKLPNKDSNFVVENELISFANQADLLLIQYYYLGIYDGVFIPPIQYYLVVPPLIKDQ